MSLSNTPALKRRARSLSSDEPQVSRNWTRAVAPQAAPPPEHLEGNEDSRIPAASPDRIKDLSPREFSNDEMSRDSPRSPSHEEADPLSSRLSPPAASPSPSPYAQKAYPDRRALEVPDAISLRIHLYYGVPLRQSRIRKSWPEPVIWRFRWDEDDIYSLVAKVQHRIKRAALNNFKWPSDQPLYVRPSRNAAQMCYLPLNVDDYEAKLKRAWKSEAKRLPGVDEIVVDVFAYLTDASNRSLATGSEGHGQIKRKLSKSGAQGSVDNRQNESSGSSSMAMHSANKPSPPSRIDPPVEHRSATLYPSQHVNVERTSRQHITQENETRKKSEYGSFTVQLNIPDWQKALAVQGVDSDGQVNVLPKDIILRIVLTP